MLRKIFCKRRILVITDEDIKNYPLTAQSQLAIIFGVLGFISWASFSSGKYFTFKSVIANKEAEVHQANLINVDLQTKVDNLQSNLVKLNEYFSTVKEFDYNQEKKKDKKTKELSFKKKDSPLKQDLAVKRFSFEKKKEVIDNINSNAVTRISNIKHLISLAGLSVSDVDVDNDGIAGDINLDNMKFLNQGGPNTTNVAKLNYEDGVVDADLKSSENIEQLIYLENLFYAMPFATPMKRYYISSRYGHRRDPMTKRKAAHYGLDFAGPIGAKVYSTAPGVVKFAGRKGNYGKFIEIDHGFDIITRYAHLSKVRVKKGQKIERGQLIGNQGNSGRSSGPHLHYEVRFQGKNYNPEKFIKAGKHVF